MIKQLKVSLANRPGTLLGVVSALAEAGVDLKALQVNDRGESGEVRMIVSDLEKARQTLEGGGHSFEVVEAVVAEMDDRVGGLASILRLLEGASINVEALYAFVTRVQGKSLAVLNVSDKEKAEALLQDNGVKTLSSQEQLENATAPKSTSLGDHLGVDFFW
jgi:hypothetical protein